MIEAFLTKINEVNNMTNPTIQERSIYRTNWSTTMIMVLSTSGVFLMSGVLLYNWVTPKKAEAGYVLSLMNKELVDKFTEYAEAKLNNKTETVKVFENDGMISEHKRVTNRKEVLISEKK